jgi:hypothetical protein
VKRTGLTLGLLALAALVIPFLFPSFRGALRCSLRGHHRPERHGATYRCRDCSATGPDLESMGEDVALAPTRRTYERQHGTLTRSSWDEPLTATERPGRDRGFYRGRVLPMDERFRRAMR